MNKTTISAEIIADSKNEHGQRLITYVLKFPRIILAELNTHRMFSRNSASSRAIPFKKMLERVQNDPFIPIAWQKDHPGMQGTEYFTDSESINDLTYNWLAARTDAVSYAQQLSDLGVTKQIVNRLLEPFLWHTAIVTATEYENFFSLRCPQYYHSKATVGFRSKLAWETFNNVGEGFEDAMPNSPVDWLKINKGQGEIHIMALAEAMWDAMNESTPKQLEAGEWHIPFGDKMDIHKLSTATRKSDNAVSYATGVEAFQKHREAIAIKIATARCARVSYMNFDGTDDYSKDIALYDRLSGSGHWSPFEHCAQAMTSREYNNSEITTHFEGNEYPISIKERGFLGNFRGFIQLRKTFTNENRTVKP